MTIKLELSEAEVNVILRSLAKHPFEEISNLIFKIKKQGDPQVVSAQESEEKVEPEAE